MVKEKVGIVTKEEKNEILRLYERKIALTELLMTLTIPTLDEEKNYLYKKIIGDMGRTKLLFDSWWGKNAKKYNWKFHEGGKWNIDFKTNEVFYIE